VRQSVHQFCGVPIQLEGNTVIVASSTQVQCVIHQVGATELKGAFGCTGLAAILDLSRCRFVKASQGRADHSPEF